MADHLLTLKLTPYRAGCGPRFELDLGDTGRTDKRGCSYLGYCFTQYGDDETGSDGSGRVIFEGSDFAGSPLHADDSIDTLAALLCFLTLRPGDTDAEYFAEYTPEQTAFAEQHAETLSLYSEVRELTKGMAGDDPTATLYDPDGDRIMPDKPTLTLEDDGTLDTVVTCDTCGRTERFDSEGIERDANGPTADAWSYMEEAHAEDCGGDS